MGVYRTENTRRGWALRAIRRTHKCKSCGAELRTSEEIYDGEKAAAENVAKHRDSTLSRGLQGLTARCDAQEKEIARLKRELRARPAVLAKDLTKLERVAVAFERQSQARHQIEDLMDAREIEQLVAVGY